MTTSKSNQKASTELNRVLEVFFFDQYGINNRKCNRKA